MTDDLETDLRTLLATRAASVTADPAAGEQAIAARLADGDHSLADVVPLAPSRHRGRWLLAAAAAAVVVVAGALVLRDDDNGVETGPVASTSMPTAPAVVLGFAPVVDTPPTCDGANRVGGSPDGDCVIIGEMVFGQDLVKSAVVVTDTVTSCDDTTCADGTGSTVEETYSVAIALTADGNERFDALAAECAQRAASCPSGRLAILIDDQIVSAPTIQAPSSDGDQITISGIETKAEADRIAAGLVSTAEPGSTTAPSSTEDPLAARDGESAKDVAERVALEVFGDTYVTTGVDTPDSRSLGAGTEVVTMEGERGDALVAYVVDGPDGPPRVAALTSPDLDGKLTTVTTNGLLTGVQVPTGGSLVLVAYDADLQEVDRQGPVPLNTGSVEFTPVWESDAAVTGYLAFDITTEAGQVQRALVSNILLRRAEAADRETSTTISAAGDTSPTTAG